jgi:hypothetical protein
MYVPFSRILTAFRIVLVRYPLLDVGALQVITDDQPMGLSRLGDGDMAFLPERGQNANVFGICFRS